jgi:carboxypeptidase C (cathepsin A)
MKFATFTLGVLMSSVTLAGQTGTEPARPPAQTVPTQQIELVSSVTTSHTATIKGQRIPYTATAATYPAFDDTGKPVASLFHVFYKRSDVKDSATRPLLISFNGGPGSASVWMHIGYTGPKFLEIDSEGFPIQPYGVRDNPHSVLDVADIVYIDPVNTGFSRMVPGADRAQFFGVNEDIAYLARWIDGFVTREGRWRSPKFLIGESYGTTRVSGLVAQLQQAHWMFFNGVVLVSPTGLGLQRQGPVGAGMYLPYYAAAAWYHKALPPDLQARDLDDVLKEVEQYTIDHYIPALTRAGSLDAAQRKQVAQRVARYSGIDEQVVLQHNLSFGTSFFWKELLRDRGLTIGRLDSRYTGINRSDAGISPDFDPALTSWNHAFAPAINYYLRDVLGYRTGLQYWLFGPVHPWNREGDNTGLALQSAMAQNPFLHLMVQSGYFDGGTDYFGAKYNLWQMDPGGKLQKRIRFEGYRSGHMMYLRQEDLATSNEHVREFIRQSIPPAGTPAR